MKKWYKGEIKVLYDAEHILNSDIGTEMMALEEFILQADAIWTPIKDIEIGDMEEEPEYSEDNIIKLMKKARETNDKSLVKDIFEKINMLSEAEMDKAAVHMAVLKHVRSEMKEVLDYIRKAEGEKK